jgi:hypothetical protein
MNVTIYKADPIATFDQIPSPAPIDQQTGRVDVTLDARESYSPVPGGSIVRYEWDFNGGNIFGDGAGASVVVFRKIYNNLNPNNIPKPTVKLRVTDDKGRQTVFQKNISYGIGDVPPTADADPSDAPEIGYHILQGDSLTLSAAQSVEPNVGDRIRFYRWRLNYNPNTENYQTLSNWDFNIEDANGDRVEEILVVPPARLAQLGMANLGTYPIVMEVQDTTFLRARDRSTITVHPVNPIAVATIDPTLAACGQRITLDGSASKHTHPAITIVSYEWDMNSNGTYNDPVDVTGKTTTVLANQYTFNGPTTITLRITDSRGNRATAQVSLNVNQGNSAPSVNPGGPYYIALADAKLKLNGSLSVEPNATCGDQIVSYRWDVGNNGGFEAALENVVSPELTMAQLANYLGSSAKGVYKVKLETRDRFGAISSAITDINIIQGPTAIASVAPSTASCNAVVQFDAGGSFTDGPINQGFALSDFRWDLDGNEVNGFETVGKTVSRNAVDFAGTKTVRLSVSDASGRVSQISTNYTITINNLPPRSSAGGPYTAAIINNVKQAITLDARASTDPNLPCDQLTRYDWDTDDDNLFGAEDTNGVPGRAGSDYSGDVVNGYINPNWNVGLTYPVKVRTCDRSYTGAGSINTACNVAATEIFITNNAPPQAELTYPRSTDCVADTNFQVRATVKDQEGGVIQAKVTVDGVVMVTENINTTANQVYNYQTTIDARRFPEGFKAVAIEFTDSQNGKTIVNSGGNVPFDRTPPQVDIGNLLLANVCYANNQVPIVTPTISDNVDLSPVVNQEVLSNSCEKTLKVTGKDRCNNQTIVSRLYRVAEPVGIDLSAPADNALVASTTINWSLLSPPSCVNEITANISYNGQERVYGPNTLLDVAGDYTFTLNVPNCIGDTVQYRRAFKINGKPVALPVPAGHPSADNAAQIPTYLTTEGAVLRLEGDDSRPPELGDSISAWRWDYNRDGTIDAQGMQVLYNTNQNGVFPGALTVADSFGLTHTQNFEVVITDVNPILDLGGPYSIAQGQPLSFNASASRPANDADPLNQFIWTWGDNTANSTLGIPAGFTPIHTYDEDGQYEVRVTLKDEDSQVQKMIQVNVRDVQPEIIGIEVPAVAYALQDLTFVANARTNAPADPIVSYDWDFLGNGRFQEQPNPETIYQYLEEGTYQAVLRVRDDDSFTTRNFTVVVRGVSLSDILRDIKLKVNELYQSQQISDRAKAAVNPDGQKTILELCDLGLWAEAQRDLIAEGNLIEHTERMRSFYRGNTLMIFDEILFRLNRAQSLGTDLGLTMWKISRQLLREVEGYQNQIISQYAMANIDPSFAQAQNLIVVAKQIFNNVDFLDRVIGRDGYLARDLYGVLYESFFLLRNYTDPTRIYNEFPMPTEGDPVRRVFDANAVNDDLAAALAQIQSELADYLLAASNAQTPGPGVQPISDAVQALAQIQAWIAKKIGLVCVNADPTSPECDFLSDRDNLYLQLALMDLVGNLFAAADQGVYVRNLQNLLTFAVKFRVEVALLAVEQQCGVYNPYPMAARAQQEILLNLLDQKQNDAALLFYIAPERRCLVMQQYNECVVPALNRRRAIDDQISKEVYPEFCEASGLAGAQQGVVIPGQDLPIPYRQPLIDVTLLYDIIRAFILDLNPANPVVLANSFPGRTWKEMNRYYRDQNFDLNDVNTALVQFNHDIYDVDQDGIIGIVEIDCDIKFNIPLDPNRARSIDNIEDGKRDCDADGISNEEEVRIKLNPVEAADAQLDTDADGLTNFDEWKWAKLGLPVDLRDPTDAAKDFDMDGVSNVKEIKAGFDPINMMDVAGDFDGDGLSNAVELNNGLDPRNRADADQDPDMDMLSSRQEIARGRNPLVKDCEADTVELSGRDDSAITARTVQFTDGYAEFSQGVICGSRNNNDEDWFAIEIPDNGYRLSVAVRATNGDTAISARLYDSVNQAQLAVSETLYPSELVVMARNQLNFGRYLVKISHTQGDLAPQTPYFVTFHLTPPTRPCLSDHLEGMTNNNQMTSAYIVGNTSVRDGAVWVCDGERNVGDWYRVDVSNKDKTVHIGYAPNTDGKLELSAMTQDFSAYAESTDVQKSGQCINIKASGIPTAVYINVTASTVFSDGDDRVDYTLQILETDLLARPRGECDVLNNGLYQFYTWPTLGL